MQQTRPRVARDVLAGDVLEVAPGLLGATLVHRTPAGEVAVRLTEVEAYAGRLDPGSHAFRGRTPRVEVMFGAAGHLYVYFTYGMHWCANVVCGAPGEASAVLLRAGRVVRGVDAARAARPAARRDDDLARGPARLTAALGIGRDHNGSDLCGPAAVVWLEPAGLHAPAAHAIRTGPRVGVSGPGGDGGTFPWRFWVDGDPTASVYRPGTPRRRRDAADGRLSGTRTPGVRAGRDERKPAP